MESPFISQMMTQQVRVALGEHHAWLYTNQKLRKAQSIACSPISPQEDDGCCGLCVESEKWDGWANDWVVTGRKLSYFWGLQFPTVYSLDARFPLDTDA